MTRQRLIEAALSLLRDEGTAALSSVRIAQAAGIAQSGFYRYFADVDCCVAAGLTDLGAGLRRDIAERRRALLTAGAGREAFAQHYLENLELVRQHGKLVELLVKRRFDPAATQRPLAALVRGFRADLKADFVASARALGRPADHGVLGIAAELVIGASLAASEALVDGRLRTHAERAHAAGVLAALGEAGFLAALESPPAAPAAQHPPSRASRPRPRARRQARPRRGG